MKRTGGQAGTRDLSVTRLCPVEALSIVIRNQKLAFRKQRQRINVEVVGMAVREPMIFSVADHLQLTGWNFVVMGPATKIRIIAHPRIRGQNRPIIVRNNDRIPNGFKKTH